MIPDNIVFGWKTEAREGIFYGEVRRISDENQLISLLKLRLDAYYFSQIEPLIEAKSAFPLLVMTCIGMETLGKIFTDEPSENGDSFVVIAKKMDQIFGRNPGKTFRESFQANWPTKDWAKIDCFGRLLFKYLRNTMVHGYQGKAVFLSYEDTESYLIFNESGYMVINPKWLWVKLTTASEQLFDEAIKGQANSPIRKNCLAYIRQLLDG
jgi:hypothetical protein